MSIKSYTIFSEVKANKNENMHLFEEQINWNNIDYYTTINVSRIQ